MKSGSDIQFSRLRRVTSDELAASLLLPQPRTTKQVPHLSATAKRKPGLYSAASLSAVRPFDGLRFFGYCLVACVARIHFEQSPAVLLICS